MSRRKITDEAESAQEQDTTDQEAEMSDEVDDDRQQLTQRMPPDLVDDVDDLADRLGMSRNAAINMLVEQGLDKF